MVEEDPYVEIGSKHKEKIFSPSGNKKVGNLGLEQSSYFHSKKSNPSVKALD